MFIHRTDNRTTVTLYTSVTGLKQLREHIDKVFSNPESELYALRTKEVLEINISAGLPKLDYGQTVVITFRHEVDASNFESYQELFSDTLILGA